MNNLEDITYREVCHPDAGKYEEWRKKLKPNYFIVWRDIALGYLSLAILFTLGCFIPINRPLLFSITILMGSVLAGFVLAYLSLFLHEAGHFNIHPDKKKNDRLAAIFVGVLFGTDIGTYRKIHWQHHIHLGTTKDTENSYFNAPTPLFLFETFTGLHLLKVLKKKKGHILLTERMKKNSSRSLFAGGVINISIVLAFILTKEWACAVIWIAGMLIFFPFFATLRQILEHRDELANDKINYHLVNHGKVSRIFTSRLFSRLFGAAGFNKHMIHHWDPGVSYTRLKDVERFLSECDATKNLVKNSKTTYVKTFRKLVLK